MSFAFDFFLALFCSGDKSVEELEKTLLRFDNLCGQISGHSVERGVKK